MFTFSQLLLILCQTSTDFDAHCEAYTTWTACLYLLFNVQQRKDVSQALQMTLQPIVKGQPEIMGCKFFLFE